MTGIPIDDCDEGGLVIATTNMRTPAWYVLRLYPLWQYGARKGSNREVPDASGSFPLRRRLAETLYSLPMVISGEADLDGHAHANVWVGFQENYDYLVTHLVADPGTESGTRAAVLTMPSGATRTADVQVLGIELGVVVNGRANASLELVIPEGRFS